MKIKRHRWGIQITIIILVLVLVFVFVFGWIIFEDNRRLLCRFALRAVATPLELYQDRFGELPPTLEILSKEFPYYRKFVYLGYKTLPLFGRLNGASLLYNRIPSDNSVRSGIKSPYTVSQPHIRGGNIDDILLAAPIPILGKRLVIFHRDFSNLKRSAPVYYISESDFSNYWTTDKQKQQLIPRGGGSIKK